jgi:hypothetical protein
MSGEIFMKLNIYKLYQNLFVNSEIGRNKKKYPALYMKTRIPLWA